MITWLAASHYVTLIIFLFSERGTSKWCKAPPDVMHPLMITWLAASHYVTLISFLFSERGTSKWCTHYWLRFVYMSGSGGVMSWIQWKFQEHPTCCNFCRCRVERGGWVGEISTISTCRHLCSCRVVVGVGEWSLGFGKTSTTSDVSKFVFMQGVGVGVEV